MKILQNSDIPIYKQIASQFKEDIMNGRLSEGDYLPSIRGLARDLKIFAEKGYEMQKGEAFDLFPRTHHVETVVCLVRE